MRLGLITMDGAQGQVRVPSSSLERSLSAMCYPLDRRLSQKQDVLLDGE